MKAIDRLIGKRVIILADEPNSGFTETAEVVAEEAVHFADRLIEMAQKYK